MFVRNCWYVIGWSRDLEEDGVLARTVLDEPLVVYRKRDGSLGALQDRCCHRQAPLSLGQVEGDNLRCMYHGLLFDASGRCVEVPGQDTIPDRLRVPGYRAVEHRGLVWVWLGDEEPGRALPDLYWHDSPDWAHRPMHNHMDVDYRLVIDNLLDLSHLAWTHRHTFGTDTAKDTRPELEQTDTGLCLTYRYLDTPITRMHSQLADYHGNVDREHVLKWHAPSMVTLESTYWRTDDDRPLRERPALLEFRTSHFVTPETETATNYFWSHFNQAEYGSEEEIERTYAVVEQGIVNEDLRMIEAQQRNMKPGYRMQPVYWDQAPGLGRTMIDRLIDQERQAGAAA